jgi:hypothetical protein
MVPLMCDTENSQIHGGRKWNDGFQWLDGERGSELLNGYKVVILKVEKILGD